VGRGGPWGPSSWQLAPPFGDPVHVSSFFQKIIILIKNTIFFLLFLGFYEYIEQMFLFGKLAYLPATAI
jgi:hypothetical protein